MNILQVPHIPILNEAHFLKIIFSSSILESGSIIGGVLRLVNVNESMIVFMVQAKPDGTI